MELGHHSLQLIMSVALILTAAVVACICDALKRNNDQLREMNIELQIRHEEDHRRATPRVTERPERVMSEKIAPPAPPVPKQRSVAAKEKKRTVNSDALAVMARGAALAGTGMRPRSEPRSAIAKPEPAPSAPKKDWGSLLSRNAQMLKPQPPPQTGIQTGFHDGHVLKQLVQSHQPVSGLVVSIGVNASNELNHKLPEEVSKLVESLIGPDDFAAQSGEDEFLLIYPKEHGAAAQRRLSQIARQLWDFQLRSLGSLEILFSWGGVEVQSESIEEALASASDRMQETKRGRKLIAMESPTPAAPLRQAV
jgi:hypothetical protein